MYKILLIEDDRPLAGAMKSQLESYGYDVVCVTDFEKVTEEFSAAAPNPADWDCTYPRKPRNS